MISLIKINDGLCLIVVVKLILLTVLAGLFYKMCLLKSLTSRNWLWQWPSGDRYCIFWLVMIMHLMLLIFIFTSANQLLCDRSLFACLNDPPRLGILSDNTCLESDVLIMVLPLVQLVGSMLVVLILIMVVLTKGKVVYDIFEGFWDSWTGGLCLSVFSSFYQYNRYDKVKINFIGLVLLLSSMYSTGFCHNDQPWYFYTIMC